MERDMLEVLYDTLKDEGELETICIRSFIRPEALGTKESSIVLRPVTSPIQVANASNTSFAKRYTIQVNVESGNRLECKRLQKIVEKVFGRRGFYQTTDALSNLEDYIEDIGRYVDVRTYKGRSRLYEND